MSVEDIGWFFNTLIAAQEELCWQEILHLLRTTNADVTL